MTLRFPLSIITVFAIVFPSLPAPLRGAETPTAIAAHEKKYLADVKAPAEFDTTLFAAPPMVNYPVFVSAAPDGTVYVSSDKNGSLDRQPHRGRILRLRDMDGDGRADEMKEFVKDVDSPRGLVWDHDRLYLLHPPHISVFIDKDGDGIADEERVIVKNIGFTFKDRPADHASNGLELGIDGWLYAAIGDFGFREAEGTDGRKLQLRGGGVVRVRPDGTGLEIYARGTRNILEACVSPLLDIFSRDNTNDGNGWDVRLHHHTGLGVHGYPSLFKNFSDEIIQPLADYGGGSGTGGLYLDEPGFPPGFGNALYTTDWGRSWIYRHPLVAKGSTFTAQQKEFIALPRVTDLDVDASSRLYLSSWKGATFTYAGEEAGFLVRATPKGYRAEKLPDFEKLADEGLVRLLESPSHRRRMEAQRTLVRRGLTTATTAALEALAVDAGKPLASRVAAVFAVKQGLGKNATAFLVSLARVESIREYAIRALCDRLEELDPASTAPVLAGLKDANPRVRVQAAIGVARLGKKENAAALTGLLDDADAVVAHTAVQALRSLGASEACFAVLDSTAASAMKRAHAVHVLQSFHEKAVVDGLIGRLEKEKTAARREGLLTALCRLNFIEGEWKGDSWSTRPDTSGPYYQTEPWTETLRITGVLKEALAKASEAEAAFLVTELSRHKIQSDDLLGTVISMAQKSPALLPAAVGQLARSEHVPPEGLSLLARAVESEAINDVVRAQAVIALAKLDSDEAYVAMMKAMPRLAASKLNSSAERDLNLGKSAFFNAPKLESHHELFDHAAARLDGTNSVWADVALIKITERRTGSAEARMQAQKELDAGWAQPARRAQILEAAALASARNYREKILSSMEDPDVGVVKSARHAASVLRLSGTRERKGTAPLIGTMPVREVIAGVLKTAGDRALGEQLFTQQTCVNCHTVSADQPLKGPFLGTISTIYKRADLAENILLPNKTIAQGFVTQHFELKDGTELDGFVTLEAADKVTVRNAAAQELVLKVGDIARREKRELSIMPEGLVANLNLKEFASLLDYLESLNKK